jgi:REP element-mobilizing transposase RayT
MSAPRPVIEGRTYLVSRRCTQREFLLTPDDRVRQVFLYCLGIAAEQYGVALHGWIAMSNHIHVLVTDKKGNYPAFIGYFHALLARCLNCYHGRWENFWAGGEQASVVHCVDAEDGFIKNIYLLDNPVADHLVDRVGDWPGACSFPQQLTGLPQTVKRPPFFFDRNGYMPEEVELHAERLPGFEHLSDEEWAEKLREAVFAAERQARRVREEKKLRVLGRKAVLAASPTDKPSTIEPRRNLRPNVACKNAALRIAALQALLTFRADYVVARHAFIAGDRGVVFPRGTYQLKLRAGVTVATGPPS